MRKPINTIGDQKTSFLLLIIVVLGFVLRVFKLDSIPAAMWGDVIEHQKIAYSVLDKGFSLQQWFGGDGPIFTLFLLPLALLGQLSFSLHKLVTVLIGTILIPLVFLYSRTLTSSVRVGLLAASMTAISFWLLSYSRQGKPYILVPVMNVLILLLLLQKKRVLAGVIIGIGMYVQASFWGAFGLVFYHWQTFISASLIGFVWLLRLPDLLNSQAYIGGKLDISQSFVVHVSSFFRNIYAHILSIGYRGDPGFRGMIPGMSLVNELVAVFFWIGFCYLLYLIFLKKKWKYWWYLMLPLLMLQIPALMDLQNSTASPNSGRLLGIAPLIYVVSSIGITHLVEKLKIKQLIAASLFSFFIALVCSLNFYRYFYIYPLTLPNKNVPFDRIIASHISELQPKNVILLNCCWGEWGQPEPGGIEYQLDPKIRYRYIPLQQPVLSRDNLAELTNESVWVLSPNSSWSSLEIAQKMHPDNEYVLVWEDFRVADIVVFD
jgi:hypothetical protein